MWQRAATLTRRTGQNGAIADLWTNSRKFTGLSTAVRNRAAGVRPDADTAAMRIDLTVCGVGGVEHDVAILAPAPVPFAEVFASREAHARPERNGARLVQRRAPARRHRPAGRTWAALRRPAHPDTTGRRTGRAQARRRRWHRRRNGASGRAAHCGDRARRAVRGAAARSGRLPPPRRTDVHGRRRARARSGVDARDDDRRGTGGERIGLASIAVASRGRYPPRAGRCPRCDGVAAPAGRRNGASPPAAAHRRAAGAGVRAAGRSFADETRRSELVRSDRAGDGGSRPCHLDRLARLPCSRTAVTARHGRDHPRRTHRGPTPRSPRGPRSRRHPPRVSRGGLPGAPERDGRAAADLPRSASVLAMARGPSDGCGNASQDQTSFGYASGWPTLRPRFGSNGPDAPSRPGSCPPCRRWSTWHRVRSDSSGRTTPPGRSRAGWSRNWRC